MTECKAIKSRTPVCDVSNTLSCIYLLNNWKAAHCPGEMFTTTVLLSILSLALGKTLPQYEHVEEWGLWKSQHEKTYQSELEDLSRHLVWLSNKKFIDLHNANAHVFGYTLAMNHFGDMVSVTPPVKLCKACSLVVCKNVVEIWSSFAWC